MIPQVIVAVAAIGAEVASADAKRRADQGLPAPPPPPPPKWQDKCADLAFWALVFWPVIAIAAIVGMALYILLKITFALHGITFP